MSDPVLNKPDKLQLEIFERLTGEKLVRKLEESPEEDRYDLVLAVIAGLIGKEITSLWGLYDLALSRENFLAVNDAVDFLNLLSPEQLSKLLNSKEVLDLLLEVNVLTTLGINIDFCSKILYTFLKHLPVDARIPYLNRFLRKELTNFGSETILMALITGPYYAGKPFSEISPIIDELFSGLDDDTFEFIKLYALVFGTYRNNIWGSHVSPESNKNPSLTMLSLFKIVLGDQLNRLRKSHPKSLILDIRNENSLLGLRTAVLDYMTQNPENTFTQQLVNGLLGEGEHPDPLEKLATLWEMTTANILKA